MLLLGLSTVVFYSVMVQLCGNDKPFQLHFSVLLFISWLSGITVMLLLGLSTVVFYSVMMQLCGNDETIYKRVEFYYF